MNRNQFAKITAEAYMDQFVNGNGVMNEAIIVYDATEETFGWQSSLTPVYDNEVIVLELHEGMFGSDDMEAELIEDYLIDSASNDIWNEVTYTIQQARM